MDVDREMKLVKSLDGAMNSSALEHSVPEQLFSTPENPAEGISAVKALQIANSQGIPIYTITKDNIATVLPQLQLDADTIIDIRNAVNARKEVTVSKTNITFKGWHGCGYIITDTMTGTAGYIISKGFSGGWIIWQIVNYLLAYSVSEAEAAEETPEGLEPLAFYIHIEHYLHVLLIIVSLIFLITLPILIAQAAITLGVSLSALITVLGLVTITILAGTILAVAVIAILYLLVTSFDSSAKNRTVMITKKGARVWSAYI